MYKRIQSACVSHQGNVRQNNEDNFFYNDEYLSADSLGTNGIITQKFPTFYNFNKGLFYAVFDGMGGGDYGEIASFKCAEETKLFLSNPKNINCYDITPSLNNLCNTLNEAVCREKQNLGVYQMGSTLVSAFMMAGLVWICNVGDSRCYWYSESNNSLSMVSVDHVEESSNGGKPVLTQYFGIDPEALRLEPTVNCIEPNHNDRIILCSDGLTDMVSENEIFEALKIDNPLQTLAVLSNKALEAGGKDNITIIVIKFS